MTDDRINGTIDFLNATPTPFHAVRELERKLVSAGAKKTTLSGLGEARRGETYYVVFEDTGIAAFHAGKAEGKRADGRLKIAAAHVDHPCFKVKTASLREGCGALRINVEMYGGAIMHTWLDRPLKLAGRVYFNNNGQTVCADVADFGKRYIIPNAAIHMNSGVNDGAKFSVQNQLLPLFGLESENSKEAFAEMIAAKAGETAGVENVSAGDILSFDLSVLGAEGASICGNSDEFISAQGLDDKGMVWGVFGGFLDALAGDLFGENDADVRIAFAFNHEECGSQTVSGAKSVFAVEIIKKIVGSFFPGEHFLDVCGRSLLLSADMAHATHPSFPELSDNTAPVKLGEGIVLKTAWNQSYATESAAMAEFVSLCRENDIRFQVFTNNSDKRGGGTIGPVLASELGIKTCDVGIPLLAMHSVRELEAVEDQLTCGKLFGAFYR